MSLEFELPLFSFIFLIILGIVYFLKKKVRLIENIFYEFILILSTIEAFGDTILHFLCSCYPFTYINGELYSVFNITNKFLALIFIVIFTCLLGYTITISYRDKIKKLSTIVVPLVIIDTILAIVLLFTNIELIQVGNVTNVTGSTMNFSYVVVAILLLVSIFVSLLNFNKIDKRYMGIYSIMIFLCLAYIMIIYFPGIIIYDVALALLCYVMYFTIENPDVKMIEQINIAKDHAERANAAKTDFLSSMSHEIRTPLNAIVGFSEAIEEETDVEAMKSDAKDIVMAAHNLLELVNGILDISKIEANKMEIVEKDYSPKEIFNDLAKLIKPRIGEKPIELEVNIAKDLPAVLHGDEGKVKQITTNILTNAVKYTEKGSIKYNVNCVNMNNTSSLVISVEDTGRGIKDDQINKLFNKFERLDEDRNTTLEGTGLGLAITKRLVEMMGGKIVVQSVYGSGSKFTIYLKQEIKALTGSLEKEEEKPIGNNDFSNSKVLVVDDNLLNLKVAKRLLKTYNIDIYDSDSGFDCLSKIESGELYDLILLDDMMPKMSGSETLTKLKKLNNFKTPVVVLTANAIEGMKDGYLAKGFNDYLAKPIEKVELERVLNKFLKPTEKDKVEVEEKKEEVKESKEQDESTYNNRTYLEENDIDVNHGLELLGDMDMYNSIMNDFVKEMEDRLPKLEEYKNNSDMENYAILVHAIKSDCKYLGIMKLADHNYEHELKSKANDIDFVLNDYDNLIKDINHYLEICKKYINK